MIFPILDSGRAQLSTAFDKCVLSPALDLGSSRDPRYYRLVPQPRSLLPTPFCEFRICACLWPYGSRAGCLTCILSSSQWCPRPNHTLGSHRGRLCKLPVPAVPTGVSCLPLQSHPLVYTHLCLKSMLLLAQMKEWRNEGKTCSDLGHPGHFFITVK